MPSYLVTGGNRGIGLAFVRQLSWDINNQVFVIVRDLQRSPKLTPFLSLDNVYAFEADIVDIHSLKRVAGQVSKITGGSLDVLINNAGFIEYERNGLSITDYDDEDLINDSRRCFDVNTLGPLLTIKTFIPLLRMSPIKKIITLSSGLADCDFTLEVPYDEAVPYSISKASLNMAITKYAASLGKEGFIFVAISPGVVDTMEKPPTPYQIEKFTQMLGKFTRLYPDFQRPLKPDESVTMMLAVISKLTPEQNGAFISQHGNKDWL